MLKILSKEIFTMFRLKKICLDSITGLKRPLKNRQNKGLQVKW